MICRDCSDVTTTSVNVSHCAACHGTFSSVSAFDAHRSGPWTARVCLDPGHVLTRKGDPRLVLLNRPYECWGRPTAEKDSGAFVGRFLSDETTSGVLTPTPGPETG